MDVAAATTPTLRSCSRRQCRPCFAPSLPLIFANVTFEQQHLMPPGWIHQRSTQQGLLFNPQTIIIGITLDSIATL
jgi:hypothetical protein